MCERGVSPAKTAQTVNPAAEQVGIQIKSCNPSADAAHHDSHRLEKEGSMPEVVKELKEKIAHRKSQLSDIQESLPRKNDPYLRVILDGIDVSFINQEQRFKFKEQYEKFKLVVSGLIFFVALLDLIVTKYRYVIFCY